MLIIKIISYCLIPLFVAEALLYLTGRADVKSIPRLFFMYRYPDRFKYVGSFYYDYYYAVWGDQFMLLEHRDNVMYYYSSEDTDRSKCFYFFGNLIMIRTVLTWFTLRKFRKHHTERKEDISLIGDLMQNEIVKEELQKFKVKQKRKRIAQSV